MCFVLFFISLSIVYFIELVQKSRIGVVFTEPTQSHKLAFCRWESIRAGLDHVSDLPADRVDVTAYFNPEKTTKDKIYCKRGGFIPDFDYDPRDYGLNMLQMEDSDVNQTLTLLKVKEALYDAGIQPFTKERKNIGVVLGIGGGQKASHEFYSRLNYVVMEKVLRKMGMPEEDVKAAVEKYKGNFPEWRLDSFPGFLGNVTAGAFGFFSPFKILTFGYVRGLVRSVLQCFQSRWNELRR